MQVFVARQPIFDRKMNIFAYELLFRRGSDNKYDAVDGDKATSSVIANSLFLIGLKDITGDKRAFINFTANLLKNDIVSILHQDQIAIEILETVEPTAEIIDACKRIKSRGFMIVLDDFVFNPRYRKLVELADVIKVDYMTAANAEQINLIKRYMNPNIEFLAEKVETPEQFEQALAAGYSYFQGYFFSKPVIVTGQDIPTNKVTFLRIMHEVNRRELNLEQLEDIFKQDVSLSYKLLRYVNSAHLGFKNQIRSIHQALVLLGAKEVTKWIFVMLTGEISNDKPHELVRTSVIRARFAELLAIEAGFIDRSDDAFLMGLLSLIDALLNRPLSRVLAELAIAEDIEKALLGQNNSFYHIYRTILAYERGHWDEVTVYNNKLGIAEEKLPSIYMNSLIWARGLGH